MAELMPDDPTAASQMGGAGANGRQSVALDARRGLRLHWIECLRGVAVLAVLLQHLFGVQSFFFFPALGRYLDLGVFGVVVFFCISGFVIPYSVIGLKRRAALRFPVARMFRLYPAYWLSLVLAVWVYHASLREALINVTMAQRFFAKPDVQGVYWTLQVELIFYLCFQAIILFRGLLSRTLYPVLAVSFSLLAISMAAVRFWMDKKAPLAPPAGLAVMFLATTWFMHEAYGLFSRRKMILFAVGIYLLLVVSFLMGYRKDWGYDEHPAPFCVTYLLSMLMFLAFQAKGVRSFVFGFLGRISYPVYLFHVPLLLVVASLFAVRYGRATCVAIDFVVIVGLSAMTHYWVEVPFVRWGKVLMNRMV